MNSKKPFSNKYTTGFCYDSDKERNTNCEKEREEKEIQIMRKVRKKCKLNKRTNE